MNGTVRIKGGVKLRGEVIPIPNKNSVLVALADKVETTIHGVSILQRRYPDIFREYRKLGARIEKVGGRIK